MLTDRNEVVVIQQCWHREINACSHPCPALGSCLPGGREAELREDGPQGCTCMCMGTGMLSYCLKAH